MSKTQRGEASVHPEQTASILADWRLHWRTGTAAFIGMGVGGSVMPAVFSLFIHPLELAFGWSRGEISAANAASFAGGIAAPLIGRMIDRVGTRRPLLAGYALAGLCWLLLAAMQGGIVWYYLLYTALTIAALPTTGLGYARVICAAFTQSRGFSLAVGRAGISIFSALLPVLLYAVISSWGWRSGYVTLGMLALLVGLPAAWWGIERNATKADTKAAAARAPDIGTSWFAVLRDWRVCVIALAAALAYAPMIAILSQAQPLLVTKGLAPGNAAMLVGLLGLTSIVGAFATGIMLDRFWAPAVAALLLACGAIGALVLALLPGGLAVATIGILLIGFTLGAEIDICAFVVARYCGIRAYGSAYGITVLAIAFASGAGSSAMGWLYDTHGDYVLALTFCAGSFLLAAASYLTLGRYPALMPE